MAPKDKDNKSQKSRVIYQFKCSHRDCMEEYIRESGRSFRDSLKEHLRAQSPIHHYSYTTGYPVNLGCFTVVNRESQGVTRTIKEAMYIQVNDPSLNRNLGKYQLPHIWEYKTAHFCSSSKAVTTPFTLGHPNLPYIQYTGGTQILNLVNMALCGVPFPPAILPKLPNIPIMWYHLW